MDAIKVVGGKLMCYFSGELDAELCERLEDTICKRARDEKIPVVFDLKKAEYISSTFVTMCIKVSEVVGAKKFSIVNASAGIKKVFEIAKLDRFLNVE